MKDFDEKDIWEMQEGDDRRLAMLVGGLFLATVFMAMVLIYAVFLHVR